MENPINIDPAWGREVREHERLEQEAKANRKKKTTKRKKPKTELVKQLENDIHAAKLNGSLMGRTHPHAVPKKVYNESDANGLTRCVVDYINHLVSDAYAWRVNNTGIFDSKTGKYRTGGGKNGQADVCAVVNGRCFQIEIKYGTDRQSKAQKDHEQRVISAGGVYMIAKTFDQFKSDFDRLRGESGNGQLNLF
jgi:hypothetical protein